MKNSTTNHLPVIYGLAELILTSALLSPFCWYWRE